MEDREQLVVNDATRGDSENIEQRGSVVSFDNIHYNVNTKKRCCKAEGREILHGVSGVFKPGTLNAIMGPTGSGKSTLLDILAKRKAPEGLTGTVLVDGKRQPESFRLQSGYVVQEDVVMGTLTVRENLQFSADLRLPSSLTKEERISRVNEVIDQLGLYACADTRVGDQFIRGVSGGEKKRCNIGMELIINPKVLFLDEPTTGLDASTANSVMRLLQRLASNGSTIIFSIHQPRYAIFKLCNTIMLLGSGYTIYQGPAMEGIEFFESLGYQIEEHDNPADFFLDVINNDVIRNEVEKPFRPELTSSPASDEMSPGASDYDSEAASDLENRHSRHCGEISFEFQKSKWCTSVLDEVASYHDGSGAQVAIHENVTGYRTNPCTQFGILCRRTLLNLMRNPRTGGFQLFVTVIFGVITGGIYYQIPNDCTSGIQNRVGAFFFIVMNQIFANLSAIDLFIVERAIFMHENASGYYRVSTYFAAKLFCDLIPYRTIPVIMYGAITYWMMGLVPRWESFLIFVLDIILTAWAACFMAFAASASTKQHAIANLIVALTYVFQMVFSNLLINLSTLFPWLRWVKYLSIFNYSMTALQINEFSHDSFIEPLNETHGVPIDCVAAYMKKQDLHTSNWDLWQNILALGVIAFGFMIIAYIQLRRVPKLK